MARFDFESQSTIKSRFEGDGRVLFTRRRTLRDRILEWSVPILWLSAIAAVIAVW
jgi:hypothetical protein